MDRSRGQQALRRMGGNPHCRIRLDHDGRFARTSGGKSSRSRFAAREPLMRNMFPIVHAASDSAMAMRSGSLDDVCRSDKAGTKALAEELPYLYCGEFNGFGPLHLLA